MQSCSFAVYYPVKMTTRILKADPLLDPKDLEELGSLLDRGGIAAIPTETVYGLSAPLFNEKALAEIFRVKGRPSDNPLIAHIGSLEQLDRLVDEPSPLFYRLAERFWPGPLTLIARRASGVPDIATGGLTTVAVRMPLHVCALQILRVAGPLAAPSANLSGRPSPTSAQDALEDLDGKIPLLVDGGKSIFGIESTVLLALDEPVLLRPGAIAREEIEGFLKTKLRDPLLRGVPLSPGMKYRHYAPKAKVHLVPDKERLREFEKRGAYILSGLTSQNLYAELRKADRLGKSDIAVGLDERLLQDEALMNRLEKASR